MRIPLYVNFAAVKTRNAAHCRSVKKKFVPKNDLQLWMTDFVDVNDVIRRTVVCVSTSNRTQLSDLTRFPLFEEIAAQ
jgi:hypothetical protein